MKVGDRVYARAGANHGQPACGRGTIRRLNGDEINIELDVPFPLPDCQFPATHIVRASKFVDLLDPLERLAEVGNEAG